MVERAQIERSLDRSCAFLIQNQQENGSWKLLEEGSLTHVTYAHPIILTSEAAKAIVFNVRPKYTPNILKALHYCFSSSVENEESIDIRAWQLSALNLLSGSVYDKARSAVLRWILSKQDESGCWPSFRHHYITNYSVCEALRVHQISKKSKAAMRNWLKSSMCKDGWTFSPDTKEPYVTATSNSVLTLLAVEENPLCNELQNSRRFLEESQQKDGYWMSKVESDFRNAHATSLAALCLMLLSEDPFNKRVEKGINYVIDCQAEEGFYLRKAIHTSKYINQFLSFYLYLKENWESSEAKLLRKHMKTPQYVTNYYWRKFPSHLQRRLKEAIHQSVMTSRILGTTRRAVERRKNIIHILSTQGSKNVAEIIDALKEKEEYGYLRKKSHLTQIKSDVEFLKDLNIIQQQGYKYYSGFEVA